MASGPEDQSKVKSDKKTKTPTAKKQTRSPGPQWKYGIESQFFKNPEAFRTSSRIRMPPPVKLKDLGVTPARHSKITVKKPESTKKAGSIERPKPSPKGLVSSVGMTAAPSMFLKKDGKSGRTENKKIGQGVGNFQVDLKLDQTTLQVEPKSRSLSNSPEFTIPTNQNGLPKLRLPNVAQPPPVASPSLGSLIGRFCDSETSISEGKGQGVYHRATGSMPIPQSINQDYNLVKRHMINVNGSDVGVIYGHVELTSGATWPHESMPAMTGRALLLCPQVTPDDTPKVDVIRDLEARPNLITIAPVVEGRALIYDQTGRGIELRNSALARLSGALVELATATKGSKWIIERGQFDPRQPHKLEVLRGVAHLVFCAETTGKLFLVVVVEDNSGTTVSIDDSLFADRFGSQCLRFEEVLSPIIGWRCFELSDFVPARVSNFPTEYLIYGRTNSSTLLRPLGIVLGKVEGPLSMRQSLISDSQTDLLLVVLPVEHRDRSLMRDRKSILRSTTRPPVDVRVAGSAVCEVYGDFGGGFTVASDSRITLHRADRLVSVDKPTEPLLSSEHIMIVDSGRIILVVRSNGCVVYGLT